MDQMTLKRVCGPYTLLKVHFYVVCGPNNFVVHWVPSDSNRPLCGVFSLRPSAELDMRPGFAGGEMTWERNASAF